MRWTDDLLDGLETDGTKANERLTHEARPCTLRSLHLSHAPLTSHDKPKGYSMGYTCARGHALRIMYFYPLC